MFDPRSAIFVCNKWDQVPPKEADLVKMDTLEKLRKCWPGVQDDQVFYLSTLKVWYRARVRLLAITEHRSY